jgi:hypothetical protein
MQCYFHLVSGDDAILDDTGVEVTDLEAAEAEALRAIQELREEDSGADEDWQGWQLNVTDRSGHLLFSIPLEPVPQPQQLKPSWYAALNRAFQVQSVFLGISIGIDYLNPTSLL